MNRGLRTSIVCLAILLSTAATALAETSGGHHHIVGNNFPDTDFITLQAGLSCPL